MAARGFNDARAFMAIPWYRLSVCVCVCVCLCVCVCVCVSHERASMETKRDSLRFEPFMSIPLSLSLSLSVYIYVYREKGGGDVIAQVIQLQQLTNSNGNDASQKDPALPGMCVSVCVSLSACVCMRERERVSEWV